MMRPNDCLWIHFKIKDKHKWIPSGEFKVSSSENSNRHCFLTGKIRTLDQGSVVFYWDGSSELLFNQCAQLITLQVVDILRICCVSNVVTLVPTVDHDHQFEKNHRNQCRFVIERGYGCKIQNRCFSYQKVFSNGCFNSRTPFCTK